MIIKISKNWLTDYVKIGISNEELAEQLSLSGTLVEKFESNFSGVIIAKISKIENHPNADKLNIVQVNDGNSLRQIVCGAPNIQVGQLVPLALPGALIGEITINEAEIREIKSSGMLCSSKELGIGDDHSGILILDDSYKIGSSLSDYFIPDTIFTLEITPNRGDCLSHLGIAREISALLGDSVKKIPTELKMANKKTSDLFSLEVVNPELCPTYTARIVENVKISDSPEWIKERLLSVGIEPINNVVDITNYIMLDLGQPMHAFDLDKLNGKKITVRKGNSKEKLTTFDNTLLNLSPDDLVIADAKNPIALAGIVGSIESGVSATTSNIILEAASFSPKSIRLSSKKHGITTDSSLHFERGVDPNIAMYALDKAAKMIMDAAGGKILSGSLKHKIQLPESKIKLNEKKISDLLGVDLSILEIIEILRRLDFKIDKNFAIVPSFRPDCKIWQDLAEEIIRVYGLKNMTQKPVLKTKVKEKSNYIYKEFIKDILVSSGFSESYNYSFVSEKDVELFNIDKKKLVEISNPVAIENRFMRDSLIYGLLKNIAKNPTFDNVCMFEIGKIFSKNKEDYSLGVISSGKKAKEMLYDFIIQFNKHFDLELKVLEISNEDLVKYKIKKKPVYYIEKVISGIDQYYKNSKTSVSFKKPDFSVVYRNISKYPAIVRDIAFIVDKIIKAEDVERDLKISSNLVIITELFDEFSSDKLGKDKKNLGFHIHFQSDDRTLNDNDADKEMKKIINFVEKKYKAKLRNY